MTYDAVLYNLVIMITQLTDSDEIMLAIKEMPQNHRRVLVSILTPKMVKVVLELKRKVDCGEMSREDVFALFG